MEDRQTYTYKKKNKSGVSGAKLFLVIFAVIVLAVAATIGVRMGTKKADTESSVAALKEAGNKAAEQPSASGSKYSPGNYLIQTGGYTLLLREQPSKSASDRSEIPDNTVIRITEISESKDAVDDNYRYWGKTEYNGEIGWVPMGYLQETNQQPEDTGNTDTTEKENENAAEDNASESE